MTLTFSYLLRPHKEYDRRLVHLLGLPMVAQRNSTVTAATTLSTVTPQCRGGSLWVGRFRGCIHS